MAISSVAPKNTASRMLRVMRLMIERRFPEIVKLISYQDTEVHKGTVYKAAGWRPIGSSKVSGKGWNTRERSKMQTTADKIRWELELRASCVESRKSDASTSVGPMSMDLFAGTASTSD
jgi:hypothetical protein